MTCKFVIHKIMWFVNYVTGDSLIFPLFQVVFFAILLFGILHDRKWFQNKLDADLQVRRGEESWAQFSLMHGLLSVLVIQVDASAAALKDHKAFFMLANLISLFYLCYFNTWFRNKTLNLIYRSKARID